LIEISTGQGKQSTNTPESTPHSRIAPRPAGTPLPAAFIREIETQLGWIAQLPWPAGIIDRQTINSLRLIPAIRRLNLVDSVGKLHARDEADGIMPPWRKRSITVRSISDDCCYMMAAAPAARSGSGWKRWQQAGGGCPLRNDL
jgi:hypothetical protein